MQFALALSIILRENHDSPLRAAARYILSVMLAEDFDRLGLSRDDAVTCIDDENCFKTWIMSKFDECKLNG